MNTISIIFLILLLNTILGCAVTYHTSKEITLADLIFSSLSGIFIFSFEAAFEIIDILEEKCDRIVLFKVK